MFYNNLIGQFESQIWNNGLRCYLCSQDDSYHFMEGDNFYIHVTSQPNNKVNISIKTNAGLGIIMKLSIPKKESHGMKLEFINGDIKDITDLIQGCLNFASQTGLSFQPY